MANTRETAGDSDDQAPFVVTVHHRGSGHGKETVTMLVTRKLAAAVRAAMTVDALGYRFLDEGYVWVTRMPFDKPQAKSERHGPVTLDHVFIRRWDAAKEEWKDEWGEGWEARFAGENAGKTAAATA